MSDNEKVDINERIADRDITLTKIDAVNLIDKKVGDNQEIEDNWKYSYKVLKNCENELSIKLNVNLGFKPETIFNIKIELEINYKLKEKITNKEIDNNIKDLLSMPANEISYIVGFITDRMFIGPYIIPPFIEDEDIIKLD